MVKFTEPSALRRFRLEPAIVAIFGLAAIAVACLYAYFFIFCMFVVYDDEGVMLASLKFFFQGHSLYDELYSCYQPFFFIFYRLVFKLWGVSLCHDSIRLLTIVFWVGGALLNAGIAYRLTSSRLLALFVMMASMLCLNRFAFEPGHPQALAYLIVAVIVLLCTFTDRVPLHILTFTLCVFAGFLLLIKINIGVFVLLPIGFALAAGSKGRGFTLLQIAIGLVMVSVPLVLMIPRLTAIGLSSDECRQFYFLVLLTLPIAGVLLVSQFYRSDAVFRLRDWFWGISGGVLALGSVCLIIMLMGTSATGLLNGLIRMPFSQSKVFFYPCPMGINGMFMALAGLSTCCVYAWGNRRWANSSWFHILLFLFKLGYGAMVLADFAWNREKPILGFLPLFWQLPFAWLLLTSTGARPHEHQDKFARLALFAIAVMQPLIAYPIAGSQLAVASVLFLVIAAVCLNDAVRMLPLKMKMLLCPSSMRLAFGCIVAIIILLLLQRPTLLIGEYYASLAPLNLPGASRIRLSEERVSLYQEIVVKLARPEVGTFLSLPGLNSFYFWAEKEPPTYLITWMSLSDSRFQERIWQEAKQYQGLMVLRNKEMIRFWVHDRPIDNLPLVRHIDEEFETVYSNCGYELMIRR
jgi:hypothetical protein